MIWSVFAVKMVVSVVALVSAVGWVMIAVDVDGLVHRGGADWYLRSLCWLAFGVSTLACIRVFLEAIG